MATNFGVELEITMASVACVAHQVRIAAPPCCSSLDVPNHPVFPCRTDIERVVRSSAALAGQGTMLLADAAFFNIMQRALQVTAGESTAFGKSF